MITQSACRRAAASVFLATLLVCAASPAQTNDELPDADFGGEVLNLGIVNIEDLRLGDVQVPQADFLPAFQGHFSIATLDFQELVGPGVLGSGVPAPNGPGQVAWWDVVVEVTRSTAAVASGQGVMISIDKDVTNNTPLRWTDFHMTVGRGVGPGFVESDEFDGLFFKTDPAPRLEVPPGFTDAFENPPMLDEPGAPDNLWWFNGTTKPGQGPGDRTDYWLAISVPGSFFPDPNSGLDPTRTRITLREHASIPEPSSALLTLAAWAAAARLLRGRGD